MGTAIKTKRQPSWLGRDALAGIAEGLTFRVPSLRPDDTKVLLRALRELFEGQDEQARSIRKGMQHYLIEVSEQVPRSSPGQAPEKMLSTEEAAELMQCSRPYVAMLIDNKKLAGATVTEGGHRRVPEASVRAWVEQRSAKSGNADYRGAAAEGGMYEIPETAFVQQDASEP